MGLGPVFLHTTPSPGWEPWVGALGSKLSGDPGLYSLWRLFSATLRGLPTGDSYHADSRFPLDPTD